MVVQWTARFPEPCSVEEAQRRQAELKNEVTQVMTQLTESRGKNFTGKAAEWRRRAVQAYRVKSANLGLLNRWLAAERDRTSRASGGRSVGQLLIEACFLFDRLDLPGELNDTDLALLGEIKTRAADLMRRNEEKHDGQTQVVTHVQPA